ncbi:MAG: fibronectin type III domain-containing protein [Methanomassiliicoccales archaeon]|nr:MAG: fibronectin type III domain-containing protein [Methanomassiliicoccales archaeon]
MSRSTDMINNIPGRNGKIIIDLLLVLIAICLMLPFSALVLTGGSSATEPTSTGWNVQELPAMSPTSYYFTMAISSTDTLHLGYVASINLINPTKALMHANNYGNIWDIEEVYRAPEIDHPSLVLDQSDGVQIASIVNDYDMYYFYKEGSTWKDERVGGSSFTEGFPSDFNICPIAFDQMGRPVIAYHKHHYDLDPWSEIGVAVRVADGTWDLSTRVAQYGVSSPLVFAIDGDGRMLIVYVDRPCQETSYPDIYEKAVKAMWIGEGEYFGLSVIDLFNRNPSSFIKEGAILFDGQGTAHVAYIAWGDFIPELRYATNEDDSWKTEVIDEIHYIDDRPAMAIDSRGRIHLAYVNDTDGTLMHALRDDQGWTKTVISKWIHHSECVRMVIDSQDRPIVGFIKNNKINIATPSTYAPSQVEDFRLESGDGYVRLRWAAPADDGGSAISGYRIYRGVDGSNLNLYVSVRPGVRSLTDSGLTNGVEYSYVVVAVNSNGEGEWSDQLKAKPSGDTDLTLAAVAGLAGAGGALLGALVGRALWR